MTSHDVPCGVCGAVSAYDTGCEECRVPELETIETQEEADAMNSVLHCGRVAVGDEWATEDSWSDPLVRELARRVLADWRRDGRLPDEATRRALATCCAE